jgi:hypothetical protein
MAQGTAEGVLCDVTWEKKTELGTNKEQQPDSALFVQLNFEHLNISAATGHLIQQLTAISFGSLRCMVSSIQESNPLTDWTAHGSLSPSHVWQLAFSTSSEQFPCLYQLTLLCFCFSRLLPWLAVPLATAHTRSPHPSQLPPPSHMGTSCTSQLHRPHCCLPPSHTCRILACLATAQPRHCLPHSCTHRPTPHSCTGHAAASLAAAHTTSPHTSQYALRCHPHRNHTCRIPMRLAAAHTMSPPPLQLHTQCHCAPRCCMRHVGTFLAANAASPCTSLLPGPCRRLPRS